jgi:quinol monooxygenase YgiN
VNRPVGVGQTRAGLRAASLVSGYDQTSGGCSGGSYLNALRRLTQEDLQVLAKVFPIKLKDGNQAKAEALVKAFAPKGPGQEDGTLSFRVYRDPKNVDYLLFVEHFADQAAYDAHTGSAVYRELIAGQFADLIVEFVEIDHELLVSI